MKLRASFYTGLTFLLVTVPAWGQAVVVNGPDVAVGYQGLPTQAVGLTSQNGVQLSDDVLLHAGVGAEGGYDSNVFYGDTDVRGSGILRVVPFVELTNRTRMGAVPSGAAFDLGTSLTYREYLSNDPLIKQQRAFMPSAYGSLEFGGGQALSLGVGDGFTRSEDPPYLRSANLQAITRNVNQAFAQGRWTPGGGRLATTLRYTNVLDIFETDNLRGANSMQHLLTLDVSWKWLPKTALFVQVSEGYTTYLNSVNGASKPNSYPLHAVAGIRGLITAKLTVNLYAGYANGFYAIRLGPTGLRGNITAGGDITYRPTMLTVLTLGYRHDFQNAILGDFFYVDSFRLSLGQAIAGRVGVGLSALYESRSFQNVPLANGSLISRHDNYWQVGANLDYHIRAWTYAGIAYSLASNGSDYSPQAADDPGRVDYVKHLFFARLGVSY